jgi:hypothetical protein
MGSETPKNKEPPKSAPLEVPPLSANSTLQSNRRQPTTQRRKSNCLITLLTVLVICSSVLQLFLYQPLHSPLTTTMNNGMIMEEHVWKVRGSNNNTNNSQFNRAIAEQQATDHPILAILRASGMELSAADQLLLPDWHVLTKLYGSMTTPVIVGMETCAAYRNTVPPNRRYAAVGGMFNTGTNAMEFHLNKNSHLPSTWQLPWGKHRMEYVRLNHTAPGMEKTERLDVLPIIMIRDPYGYVTADICLLYVICVAFQSQK